MRRVLLLALVVLAGVPGTAAAATVTLDRSSGMAGSSVTVSGSGYQPLAGGTVAFSGQASTDVFTDSTGAFTATLVVPSSAGDTSVVVRVPEALAFTVQAAPTALEAPVLSVDADGKTLRWTITTATADLDRFEVWRDGGTYVTRLNPDVRSYVPTLPADGQPHTFRVVAYGKAGGYKNSNTVTVSPAASGSTYGTLAFEDNFDGAVLDTSKWFVYTTPGDHAAEPGVRSASAISVANGKLAITATNQSDGQIVTGGMSMRNMDVRGGRWEARVRTDADPTGSLSGVLILWPSGSSRRSDGEVDYYETGTSTSRNPFYSYVHYGAALCDCQVSFTQQADASQWHTMAVDWAPDKYMRFYRDGALVWTITDPAKMPIDRDHMTIQFDAFAKRTLPGPLKMEVDYVRVWLAGG